MADRNFIIDIILNARDNTSGALASAATKLGLLEAQQKQLAEQNEKTGRSFEEMSNRIRTSQARLTEERARLGAANNDVLDSQVKLEQASKSYVKTLNDTEASEARRTQSLAQLKRAEESLALAITRVGDEEAKSADAASKASARRQQQAATEVARLTAVRAQEAEAVRAQAALDAEAARARAEQTRQGEALSAEIESNHQARHRARIDRLNQEAQAERELADVRTSLAEMESRQAAEAEAERQANWEQRQQQIREQQELEAQAAHERSALQEALAQAETRQAREAEEARIASFEARQTQIERERKDAEKAAQERERQQARELSMARQYVDALSRVQRARGERDAAQRGGDIAAVARIDLDSANAREEAERLAVELQAIMGHIEANVDLDGGTAAVHALALKEQLQAILGSGLEINVDADVDRLGSSLRNAEHDAQRAGAGMGFLRGALQALREGFHNSSGTIASFDNFLRGLLSLGIAVFFNQLFLLVTAAAGALFSLASSAGMAGAAVGGGLVAGIAQALGPLGLLVAAMARVKAVTDAVQQANLLEQQQSYQGAQQARQRATALDQVTAAQERVADSNRRITEAQRTLADAQRGVNEARREAADRLQDLLLAEQGLNLSLEENERAIRRAASRGQTGALPRLFLQRTQTTRELSTTRRDVTQRTTQVAPEVETATEGVRRAQEGLRDAQRSAREAERGLERARRTAQHTTEDVTAAAGKLNFLLGQMSGAERRLYTAILRLQRTWRSFSQEVTEPIINSFTYAINRVVDILNQPRVRNAARNLAGEMAVQFRRLFDAFTDNRAISQWLRIMAQAQRNLRPFTTIVINLGQAFMDMAEAAGPAFREILLWIRDISDKVADFMEQGRKSGELQDFFKDGVTHLKAWGDLLWQVIRLFAALAGPGGGARQGLGIVREMADAIRGWADAIETPGTKLNEFFQRFFRLSRRMIEAMTPVLRSIGREIERTFTKDGLKSVQGFSFFLSEILIPAVGQFARFLGRGVASVMEFARAHPQITRMATAFIAMTLTISTLGRAFAILGPITSVFAFLVGHILRATGAMGRLAGIGARVAGIMGRLRPLLLGPWGLAAAAILFLLQRFGRLDDVLRAIGDGFREVISRVSGPFDRLKKSVGDLVDAFSGGGGLMPVLRVIVDFIADVLIAVIQTGAEFLGTVLGEVIDIISGVVDVLTGLLTLNPRKFFGGLWRIGSSIVEGLWAGLKGIGMIFVRVFRAAVNAVLDLLGISSPSSVFRRIGGQILDGIWEGIKGLWTLFRRGFRAAFDFIRGVPGRIIGLLSDGIHELGQALESIGERIISSIIRGIKKAPGAIKDAIGGLTGGKVEIFGHNVNPLAKRYGGAVTGPGTGTSDSILARLSSGEHVITAAEVARAGGHSAIYEFRRSLGGGSQAQGSAFAQGGAVGALGQVGVTFTGNLEEFSGTWASVWDDVKVAARQGANEVERQIRDMRVNVEATMDRLYRSMRSTWSDIVDSADRHTGRLVRSVKRSIGDLTDVVYEGMKYVGTATNRTLRSFDAKPVDLNLSRPRADQRASGGMVGQAGERGKDAVLTWLGRGEAVLNWGHQKIVNSALWNQFGTTLPDLFKSNFSYHAGGPGTAPGHAVGKPGDLFDGHPGNVNSGVRRVIAAMKQRFPLQVTSTTDHGTLTTSGNVSDHVKGAAVDLSGAKEVMDRAASYVLSSGLARRLKQAIYSGDPTLTFSGGENVGAGYFGSAVMGQHANHLHLAIAGALRGQFGTAIKRMLVEGKGAFKNIAQAALDMARKGANKLLSKEAGSVDSHGGSIPAFQGSWVSVMGKIADAKNWNLGDWRALVSGESGGNPAARNPSSGAFGLGQFLGSTLQSYAKFGATSTSGDDQIRAMAQYISDRYGNPTNAYNTWLSRNPHWYAMGGPVGGTEGQPVPIVAHAGEWVINKIQQSKLAQLMGMGVGKLRDALGFSGGPTSFQDGGEVSFGERRDRAQRRGRYLAPLVDPVSLDGIIDEVNRVNRAIRNMSTRGRLGQRVGRFIERIRNLTDEDGLIDQMATSIDNLSTRLQRNIDLAQVGLRRVGRKLVARRGGALADAVEIADRTVTMYDKILDGLRDERRVALTGLNRTERRIAQLRRGGIQRGEEDQFQTLMAARRKFLDTLDEVDGKIAEARSQRFDARRERFEAETDSRLRRPQQRQRVSEVASRIAETFGNEDAVAEQGVVQRRALQAQRRVLQGRLANAQRRAARDPRWREVADELQESLDDINGRIAEQIHRNLEAGVNAVNTDIDRRSTGVELARRVSTALGRQGDLPNLAQQSINLMNEQIGRLSATLPGIINAGDVGLAQQVRDQVADLRASVTESTAAMLRDALDQFDAEMQRQGTRLDLRGRVADIRERAGDRLGAINDRQGVSGDRQSLIRSQIVGLGNLLTQAQAQGNEGVARELEERIAELNVTLREEIATTRELTFTYRQTATEIMLGRSERTTGLIGSASTIIQRLSDVFGVQNRELLLQMAQQVAQTLQGTAGQIIGNLNDAIGGGEFGGGGSILSALRDAFAQGPQEFATTLAQLGPAVAALEATMSEAERTAFQGLIQSMIDNTTAVIDNSEQVNQLTGAVTEPQNFASSAWQFLRRAIFNGMGGLLPQYEIPQLHTGGYVTRGGIFDLKVGERVIDETKGRAVEEHTHLHVTSPTEVLDPTHAAEVLAFRRSLERAT